MAARLMLNYANHYDPFVDSAFIKLNAAMPVSLKQQVQKALDWMQKLPKNDGYLRTIAALADAWMSLRQVKISYQALEAQEGSERIIEPYFIEPAAAGHASYDSLLSPKQWHSYLQDRTHRIHQYPKRDL
jgi:predicted DNA-binding transcriptional regulator YafY